jgi:hypothetical protein
VLVPPLSAGSVGWCLAEMPDGGCAAGRSRPPVIAETWSATEHPSVAIGYAITTSEVHAISVRGNIVDTEAQPSLPSGLRAAVVELAGVNPERERLPRFAPLNASGETIFQAPGRGREIARGVLASELATVPVPDPARPTTGPCQVRLTAGSSHDGVTASAGNVVAEVKPSTGLIGEGYLACASTSYNYRGWRIVASLLLSAGNPAATPSPLPGAHKLRGDVGLFLAPGQEGTGVERELLARRVPGAWLVLSGAKLRQRLAVLAHLKAIVDL